MFPVTLMMTMKAERTKTVSIEKKSIKVIGQSKALFKKWKEGNEI